MMDDILQTFSHKKFVETFVDFEVRSRFERNLLNGIFEKAANEAREVHARERPTFSEPTR